MSGVKVVPTLAALRARRQEILRVAAEYGASHIRVFGSVARGQADELSDIDLLVHMAEQPSGFAYFGRLEDLRRALTALLECPVDIMDVAALRRMRARVLAEAVLL